ncbi:IclR family transcriptional regulator [Aneurinibacillus sp. Ricciae_BoGa-3]|uniref:IclR family transcriptional regulator n=1 Tax=Aneurinibacillus sp. Ricciae_BoGa-3 TaxID=3022697 RepID=UPI00234221BB|nr:IclR family transcriptional regulator [Aneurinibacillus sp. Ricciae_BoGa-3]WCK56675.1 IclR family transcriptional regulator [Aneurinibacillus sp. Ricciae_BoGa-3]
MENKNQEYLLSSVKNALRLLRSFSLDEPEKKVTDLANSLGIGKSTVSRLLATLASEGFVIKDPETQKYRLGLSILSLNTVVTSNLEINREAQPILKRLVDEVEETSTIAVLEGMDVVYLTRVECKHPVQILTHTGRRNPFHCTSSGKVMLAYQKKDLIEQFIESGLQKYTISTITDPDDFRSALNTINQQGYAISIEEFREGVTSVAAPIRDYTGKVVYAISVTGPTHRMNPYNTTLINKVKNAAKEISDRLGY